MWFCSYLYKVRIRSMNNKESLVGTKGLNALKGIGAIFIAFVYHYKAHFLVDNPPFELIFNPFYAYGYMMVELFFILCGFGMMIGYADKIINGQITFGAFLIKRINKIYPLFLFALLLVTVGQLLFKYEYGDIYLHSNFDLYHFLINLLLIQNGIFGTEMSFNTPGWCISIYILLYIAFYLIVRHSAHKRYVVYKFLGLSLVGILLIQSGWNLPIMNGQVGRGLLSFSIGVVIAYIYEKRDILNTRMLSLLALFILIGTYVYIRCIDVSLIKQLQYIFTIFIFPLLIFGVIFSENMNKILSLSIFQYLGGISMEIYLLHFPIQVLFKDYEIYFHHGFDFELHRTWFGYVIITIATASAYKYLINARLTSLLKRIIVRKSLLCVKK